MTYPESLNEADTCREYVMPTLKEVGWLTDPHSVVEQYTFTAPCTTTETG